MQKLPFLSFSDSFMGVGGKKKSSGSSLKNIFTGVDAISCILVPFN